MTNNRNIAQLQENAVRWPGRRSAGVTHVPPDECMSRLPDVFGSAFFKSNAQFVAQSTAAGFENR